MSKELTPLTKAIEIFRTHRADYFTKQHLTEILTSLLTEERAAMRDACIGGAEIIVKNVNNEKPFTELFDEYFDTHYSQTV